MATFEDLSRHTDRAVVKTWYLPPNGRRRDIATEAYNGARDFLTHEHSFGGPFRVILDHRTTLHDVMIVLEDAKREYEHQTAKRHPILQWAAKVSQGLLHYGNVLDTLTQHHPEYTALVWGSIKFVLRGIIQHEELLAKFSQAMIDIASMLRTINLSCLLFQTDAMKDAVERLYASILLFCQGALKWYAAHPLTRAFRSIVKPYDLEYRDIVERIEQCAKNINDTAQAANRAELRDMHLKIQAIQNATINQDLKLLELQVEFRQSHQRLDESLDRALQVAVGERNFCVEQKTDERETDDVCKAHKTITERIGNDVGEVARGVQEIHFSQILQLLGSKAVPDDLLRKVRSISKRFTTTRTRSAVPSMVLATFQDWVSAPGSAAFVLRALPRAEFRAKDIAVQAIQHLQSQPIPVLWSISQLSQDAPEPTVISIIQGLLYQALSRDQNILRADLGEINAAKFHSTLSDAEWVELLCTVLTRMSNCFVVIESQDLLEANRDDPEWCAVFYQIFSRILSHPADHGASVKLLLLSYADKHAPMHIATQSMFTASIQRALPVRLKSRGLKPQRRHGGPQIRARRFVF